MHSHNQHHRHQLPATAPGLGAEGQPEQQWTLLLPPHLFANCTEKSHKAQIFLVLERKSS